MARRVTQVSTPVVEDTDSNAAPWPDGFMPGTVAPFVMRYGVDFLVAMQRAASSHDAAVVSSGEVEPA
ncbi:hypothetical protein BJI69_15950 [Luteibacter rhizovicinus DSM 16549]|uniref:Uncharacterized protein n=1 Tax=Luteibacter rhizovicinus DSM 16549 TaxID=1440763 RepID=A0A0G9HFC8_9GAMM|nr:hypothetical protein [Luteibacter rhizovicinus]APG05244.1 hypothetical protein BJI69_15950 [Luteibacter rhizovicinus DSM 16549]KLD67864.1 hypothetical protein Y883_05610 [Luteibacter rhizovicinus DSM 16549]KLD78820.1 hypothetical protein Y886_08090 [Xanthomonas hyacinthi DSM 19077]